MRSGRSAAGGDEVVAGGEKVAGDEAAEGAIGEADEAPDERNPLAEEELAHQAQMGADDRTPLEHEPICRDEDGQPQHQAHHKFLNGRVETENARQNNVLELALRAVHTEILYAGEQSPPYRQAPPCYLPDERFGDTAKPNGESNRAWVGMAEDSFA
jgi:hypothetical protein